MLLGLAGTSVVVYLWAFVTYGNVLDGAQAIARPGLLQLLVGGPAQVIGFLFATWVIGVRALGLGRAQLRWMPVRIGARGFGLGLALGAATGVVALLASVIFAGSGWSQDAGSFGHYLLQVAKTTLVLAPPAFSEELMFRGLPLVLLALAVGRGTALVTVAGVIFALFHARNPDVTMLGLGNIALAGVFLGVAFYAPGGIWTAFGAHLGWNATLAGLDAPVSGMPFTIPFLNYHAGEPVWLSGGRFGPEGGLLATLAITAALLVAARWTRKDST